RYIYGFGFNVNYKTLSVGLLFQGAEGADRVLAGSSINPFRGEGGLGNLFGNIDDRWRADNPSENVFYPRLAYGSDKDGNTNNFQPSTWWKQDVSFLRLKTVQVSYNLPKEWANRARLRNAAIYFMGN